MFIGRFYHHLGNKGRISIPKQFRSQLKSGGVLTRGLDGCLFLFPDSSWKKLSTKLASLPITSPQARQFVRLLVQSATPLSLDSQGRTLIPQHLRERANLGKNVVVAGALTRVELWDRKLYHRHLDNLEENTDQIQQQLSELGI